MSGRIIRTLKSPASNYTAARSQTVRPTLGHGFVPPGTIGFKPWTGDAYPRGPSRPGSRLGLGDAAEFIDTSTVPRCDLGGLYVVGAASDRFATVGDALRDAERRRLCRVEVRVRPYEIRTRRAESVVVTMPTTVRALAATATIGTSFRNPDGHDLKIENIVVLDAPGFGVFQRGGRLTLSGVHIHRVRVPIPLMPGSGVGIDLGSGVGIDLGGAGAIGRWNNIQVSECPRSGIRLSDNAWAAGGRIEVFNNRCEVPPNSIVPDEVVINAAGAIDIRDGASLGADLLVYNNELYGVTLHRGARLWMFGRRISGTHIGRLAGTRYASSGRNLATINVFVRDSELVCNSFEIDGRSPISGGSHSTIGILLSPRHAQLFDGRITDCEICIAIDGEIALDDAIDGHADIANDCTVNFVSTVLPVPGP